jgi:putative DNA primase/helicase
MSNAMPLNPYQVELARLLKVSTLTPGHYTPSANLRTGRHVAVFAGYCPVVLCGPADDEESVNQARFLAGSKLARRIFTEPSGKAGDQLRVGVVDGRDLSWGQTLSAIVSKPSGQIEIGDGEGPLIAILLDDPDGIRASALCIMTETARAFDPAAPELDDGRTLSRLAKQEFSA